PGTYQQTRQRAVTVLAGGSGPGQVRSQPQWRSKFFHLAMRRGRKIAKVAMLRQQPDRGPLSRNSRALYSE
ncbi:MAG: hypothetical protein ACREMY_17345, partial [bacterium]